MAPTAVLGDAPDHSFCVSVVGGPRCRPDDADIDGSPVGRHRGKHAAALSPPVVLASPNPSLSPRPSTRRRDPNRAVQLVPTRCLRGADGVRGNAPTVGAPGAEPSKGL
jgi:hypothetical protein